MPATARDTDHADPSAGYQAVLLPQLMRGAAQTSGPPISLVIRDLCTGPVVSFVGSDRERPPLWTAPRQATGDRCAQEVTAVIGSGSSAPTRGRTSAEVSGVHSRSGQVRSELASKPRARPRRELQPTPIVPGLAPYGAWHRLRRSRRGRADQPEPTRHLTDLEYVHRLGPQPARDRRHAVTFAAAPPMPFSVLPTTFWRSPSSRGVRPSGPAVEDRPAIATDASPPVLPDPAPPLATGWAHGMRAARLGQLCAWRRVTCVRHRPGPSSRLTNQ